MNIEKNSGLKREALSGEHYFQSLLEQGYLAQILSDKELEQIQFQCLALLAKKTERYNSGNSSSISVERAQALLSSLMFTIGVQLKTYPIAHHAVSAILEKGVETVYSAGCKRIDRFVKQAKMRHATLVRQLLKTENVFYTATIVDGINGFFKLYDPAFAAQEIHITADYPVYNKTVPLQGIEFIRQYIEQLYYENAFCTHFSDDNIHYLLCGYDRQYKDLLFNIYEPVLAVFLGCALSGADAAQLKMTPAAQSFLRRHLAQKKNREIQDLLSTALLKLSNEFSFSESLLAYVTRSLAQLANTIEHAVKSEMLDRIFILPAFPEELPKLMISSCEKMEDAQYRKVLREFMDCQSIVRQIDIIKSQVHSFADLNDLLLDAELSEYDTTALLRELSLGELATFSKKYLQCAEWEQFDLRSNEVFLTNCLSSYIGALSPQQQAWVKNAANAIQII